jgi:hypothetical protein
LFALSISHLVSSSHQALIDALPKPSQVSFGKSLVLLDLAPVDLS